MRWHRASRTTTSAAQRSRTTRPRAAELAPRIRGLRSRSISQLTVIDGECLQRPGNSGLDGADQLGKFQRRLVDQAAGILALATTPPPLQTCSAPARATTSGPRRPFRRDCRTTKNAAAGALAGSAGCSGLRCFWGRTIRQTARGALRAASAMPTIIPRGSTRRRSRRRSRAQHRTPSESTFPRSESAPKPLARRTATAAGGFLAATPAALAASSAAMNSAQTIGPAALVAMNRTNRHRAALSLRLSENQLRRTCRSWTYRPTLICLSDRRLSILSNHQTIRLAPLSFRLLTIPAPIGLPSRPSSIWTHSLSLRLLLATAFPFAFRLLTFLGGGRRHILTCIVLNPLRHNRKAARLSHGPGQGKRHAAERILGARPRQHGRHTKHRHNEHDPGGEPRRRHFQRHFQLPLPQIAPQPRGSSSLTKVPSRTRHRRRGTKRRAAALLGWPWRQTSRRCRIEAAPPARNRQPRRPAHAAADPPPGTFATRAAAARIRSSSPPVRWLAPLSPAESLCRLSLPRRGPFAAIAPAPTHPACHPPACNPTSAYASPTRSAQAAARPAASAPGPAPPAARQTSTRNRTPAPLRSAPRRQWRRRST